MSCRRPTKAIRSTTFFKIRLRVTHSVTHSVGFGLWSILIISRPSEDNDVNKKIWLITVMLILATVMLGLSCSPATKTSPPGAPESNTAASNPVIAITYSGTFAGQTASGLLKLVVDVTIENGGYESFNISPEGFSVTVDNYSYQSSESDIETVDLIDGDKISGRLIFQVPPVAATTRVG